MMMTDHLPRGVGGWEGREGYGFGYGGQVVTDVTQISTYGSPGQFMWGGAASTIFFVDPAERLAVVVMQQVYPGFTFPLTYDILTAVYQAIAD
jgi:CubicO group peptidase (beta-lactamase class C family)